MKEVQKQDGGTDSTAVVALDLPESIC